MIVLLLGLGLAVVAIAGRSPMGERAMMDSLRAVHPRLRSAWLRDRGFPEPARPSANSHGLGVVGRWSFGPAYDVDCRMTPAETLIALGRGSGVSLLRFSRSDTAEFQLLSDINSARVISRVRLADTLLLVGTGAGVETYSISDKRSPNLRSTLLTPLNDFAMRESLLCVMGYDDSFKVYNIADPANPRRLGACRDSGGPVTLAGNMAFVGDRWGLYAIDVSNPANPHRVGSWGSSIISAEARGNICCVTEYDPDSVLFFLLDVSNPASMHQLSTLRGAGGDALCIDGQYVYTAGGYGFQILDISDSLNPLVVGRHGLGDYKYGVWGRVGLDRALVANEVDGLAVMNTSDPSHPEPDTNLLAAGMTTDIEVKGSLAYLVNDMGGLKILDVSHPSLPTMIGELDTVYANEWSCSVAADDSFAFMGWFNTPFFRTVDVSDPTRPTFAGSCNPFEFAQDIVRRDSFAYCAESYKFQIVNTARPRAPVVVGTCALPEMMNQYGMDVKDTVAFVANGLVGLQIISVARPDSPAIVGALTPPNGACGVAVIDTFAYVASGNLYIASVAEPTSPYLIDSMVLPTFGNTLAASDSLLFVGSWDGDIHLIDIREPVDPVVVGSLGAPRAVNRLAWAAPYLYAACEDAGVLIAETTEVGVQEPRMTVTQPELRALPNPACGVARVLFGRALDTGGRLSLYDATGRRVLVNQINKEVSSIELRLTALRPGLYFMRVETKTGVLSSKLVKQ
jgi:hypothetical protein